MSRFPSCAAGVPIFRALPPEELNRLGEAMFHRRFSRGELVASAGDPMEHLVVVAHGRLKYVHTTAGGREQVVRAIGPGEFLGEMALFAPALHEGDLVAVEDSDACMVSRAAVQEVLRRHPQVALRLVEALARRLAAAEQVIGDLGVRDVGQRLAAELLRLAAEQRAAAGGGAAGGGAAGGDAAGGDAAGGGAAGGGPVQVRLPVPWAELARRLGTTPESLSRRLRALTGQGIVRQEGRRAVAILAPDQLRRMAEG